MVNICIMYHICLMLYHIFCHQCIYEKEETTYLSLYPGWSSLPSFYLCDFKSAPTKRIEPFSILPICLHIETNDEVIWKIIGPVYQRAFGKRFLNDDDSIQFEMVIYISGNNYLPSTPFSTSIMLEEHSTLFACLQSGFLVFSWF